MTFKSIVLRVAVVLLAAATVGAAAWAISASLSVKHTATASLSFSQSRPELAVFLPTLGGRVRSDREAATDNLAVNSSTIVRATAARLGVSEETVRDRTSIGQVRGTDVVTIEAEARNAGTAADTANAYASAYMRVDQQLDADRATFALERLESEIRSLRRTGKRAGERERVLSDLVTQAGDLAVLRRLGDGSPTLIDPADASSTTSTPDTTRNVLFGLLFGAVLGLGLASLIGRSRPEVH